MKTFSFRSFFLLLGALVAFALSNAYAQNDTGYEIGQNIKDFSLKDVSGQMVGFKDYQNAKGIVLVFTCNHCPFSKMYQDRLIALHKDYAPKGFPVLAVNPNDATKSPEDDFPKMVERAKEKNYPFKYVYDESQSLARQFGARRTPHAFLLQKVGVQFKLVYIGAIDDNPDEGQVKASFLEDSIQLLLEGKPVINTHTKAVGCTIKWKDAE